MTVHRNICDHLVVRVCLHEFVGWEVTVIVPPLWYAPWTWRKKTIVQFEGRGENWDCVKINNVPIKPNTRSARKHIAALNAIVSDYATDWIPAGNRFKVRA